MFSVSNWLQQRKYLGRRETYLDRLPGKRINRTSCSDLELVVHHVSQTLIVDKTKVNVGMEFFTSDTRVHRLVTVVVVTSSSKLLAKVVNWSILVREPNTLSTLFLYKREEEIKGLLERCSVLGNTVQSPRLTSHTLNKHTDSHSRRESVRVDDNIRLHTALAERHVNRREFLRTYTLLTVSGRELVTDDGRTGDTEFDVNLLELGVSSIGTEDTNFVDVGGFVALVLVKLGSTGGVVNIGTQRVTRLDLATNDGQTILADNVPRVMVLLDISTETKVQSRLGTSARSRHTLQVKDIGLVDCTITKPSLVGRLVQDHCVFHVITRVRDDSNDGVGTVGEVVETVVVVKIGTNDGGLTRLESVHLVVGTLADSC